MHNARTCNNDIIWFIRLHDSRIKRDANQHSNLNTEAMPNYFNLITKVK